MRENLIKERKSKNIKPQQIAKELGISSSFYYKIEDGVRNPTLTLAKKIANLLDSNIDYLFFNKELDKMSNDKAI